MFGCGTSDDEPATPSDDSEIDTTLPEPTIWRADRPALNSEEQARQNEVERYLARRYRGQRIVDTTQTYVGDIVDWFDPATVPGSQMEPPPRPVAMQLPPGVQLQVTEFDLYPELRGPSGTIPVIRPRFEPYVRGETEASSIEDFITNYQAPGQPSGRFRLYAGMASVTSSKRAVAIVNEFSGAVQDNTFSILEMAVVCRSPTPMELVGIAASRDKKNFGDSFLRIQVEFLSMGDIIGNGKGGWDGKVTGFVAAAGRPYGPGATLLGSTVGGIQYESSFDILLFGGNWWVGHNGNWLGYYPGNMFDMIGSGGCEVDWYGEVFDPTPTDWTSTNMGSGLFASAGYGQAAYFRRPYYHDLSDVSHWPDSAVNVSPNDLACYTRTQLQAGGTGWERYFYLGGPGGDAPGCN